MPPFRVAMVAPDAWTIWLFYRSLIEVLHEHGARVTVFSAADATVPRLEALGVRHVAVSYARFVAPWSDLRLLAQLRRAFAGGAFDVVHDFTVKANLYGALAAAWAGVPRIVNTVEGSGLLYADRPAPALRLVRAAVEAGLRRLRRRVAVWWFVNERDRALFVARGLVPRERSWVGIATGVDTARFDPASVPAAEVAALRAAAGLAADAPLVTLVAGRLLRSKGVEEFVALARGLRAAGVAAQALLVGPHEPGNPDALDPLVVERAVADGTLRWLPFREDVWTVYAASTVVVVPTYYAEGTPKGVLESMAMGHAPVCSDLPSTRPLVHDGEDAVLVPPRDVAALQREVTRLLADPARRAAMGAAARRTACRDFDAGRVARAGVARVYGFSAGAA